MTYVADDGEECFLDIVEVLGPTVIVNGVIAREVLDAEWIDVDCSQDVSADDVLEEITLDWYTQDTTGNIWYVGEDTIAFNWDEDAEEYIDWGEEECDFIDPIDPKFCRDGSWEDGEDVQGIGEGDAERGIIMLAEPDNGDFYSQEYYPDLAEDMGKVLNFRRVEAPFLGEFDNCLRTKEWNPLEPGSVEHKFYCYGTGLVLVEENAGGKTLLVDLFSIDP